MNLAAAAAGCVLLFACEKDEGEKIPPPGPLQAGAVRIRMPAPVGIGTVGYNGVAVPGPDSPFVKMFPATTRVHGHPEFKALVISRGRGHEVFFLRADTIGIFQHFRRAVVLDIEARLGRSVDDALVFAGTHTHSGPGRVIKGGVVYDFIADTFFPDYYLKMVDAAATAVVTAYEDLAPARVGHAWAYSSEGHSDRRCEDGRDYTNDAIPVLAVERGGVVDAVLFAYAVHGTGLGREDWALSRDVSGAVEQYVEAGFDHPVVALFFNSWGADMGQGDPNVPLQAGAVQPPGFERLDRIGRVVGDAVHAAVPDLAWETEPAVFAELHRVHLNREAIGYEGFEFPYEWGGLYCEEGDSDCDPSTIFENLDQSCVPIPEEFPAPPQTEISAGRIGELSFVTFPGEAGTLLAEELLSRLETLHGFANVALLGYAQDYCGYSIREDDWWQGGYEAAGHMWGPRQGEYLIDAAEGVFVRTVVNGPRAGRDRSAPDPVLPFDVGTYVPYEPTPAEGVGTVVTDASPMVGIEEVVVFAVQGSDPWLGTPLAVLQDENGDPVPAANGVPIDSDGYAFWVDVLYIPSYEDERNAASRVFLWTFNMPAQMRVEGLVPPLAGGTYRLEVSLPTETGDVTVTSSPFTIQ